MSGSKRNLLIPAGALEALVDACSASLGGIIATTVTYPLDVVKTKLATSDGKNFGNELECIRYAYKQQGFEVFLRGLPTKIAWSGIGKFMFYGTYSAFNTIFVSVMKRQSTFLENVCLGYVTELITQCFSLPFEEISTVMQHSEEGTLFGAISHIFKTHGILGFYRSMRAVFLNAITPALVTTFFTQFKDAVLKGRGPRGQLSTLESFVLGAIARCLGVIIMFPIERVKTIIQANVDDSDGEESEGKAKKPKAGVWDALLQLWRGGFFAMYRGLRPTLVRGVLSSAVTLMVKERLYNVNRPLLLMIFSTAAKQSATAAGAPPTLTK